LVAIIAFGFMVPSAFGQEADPPDISVGNTNLAQQAIQILDKRCFSCHGLQRSESHLRLDDPESRNKRALPGNPIFGSIEESELLRRIKSDDAAYRMPKNEPAISQSEIEKLEKWIGDGANFPVGYQLPVAAFTQGEGSELFWERHSETLDYLFELNDALYPTYVAALLFLLFTLITINVRRVRERRAKVRGEPNPSDWIQRYPTGVQVLVIAFAFIVGWMICYHRFVVQKLNERTVAIQYEYDRLTGVVIPNELISSTKAGIYRPKHPKRLGGEYYRGNDERNEELFNGGYYRTATMNLSLEDGDGRILQWNDEVKAGDLWIRLVVSRAPFATPALFVEENMLHCFLSRNRNPPQPEQGKKPPPDDRSFLNSCKKGESWEARYKIGSIPADGNLMLQGNLFLCADGGGAHYGIDYDVLLRDHKIDEQSELWMGAVYLTGNVVVAKPTDIILPEWFDFLPIPEITHENTHDPKLLGIPSPEPSSDSSSSEK
jgi:hypothetical protein